MGTATTIIHVSDLHLSDPRGALLSIAASPKRALALLSWTTKRRKRLNPVVLEAARRDLIAAPGEALVITGDLTNLGLPREYREARRFLQSMDDHLDVVLVPGNHDACAAEPWDETLAEWAPWLASDEDQATPFPSLRVRGLAALIGVSTARPSSPTLALGTIGPDQLEGLHRHLRVSGARGLFRVVYMHHPPVEGVVGWRKRLTDRVELERVLADAGVELLLHGHAHRPSRTTMVLGDRRIPVLGVPALSESVPGHRRGGSYNRMRIERDGQGWKLRISERRFDPESGDFSAGATEVVMVAR